MLGWSISAECLPFRLEAGQHRLGIHAGLDQLDGDQPLDRLPLLRHPDRAHAAVADLFQQLVTPGDDRADRLSIRETGGLQPVVLNDGTVDRVIDAIVGLQQPVQLPSAPRPAHSRSRNDFRDSPTIRRRQQINDSTWLELLGMLGFLQ